MPRGPITVTGTVPVPFKFVPAGTVALKPAAVTTSIVSVTLTSLALTNVPSSNLTFSGGPGGVHFLFASVTGGVNNSSTFSTGLSSFGFIPNCSTCFDGSLAIALL